MPHIDELLGAATLVSAGMFAALSLQPMGGATAHATAARGQAPVAIAATAPGDATMVCVPIKTVARRSVGAVGDASKQRSTRDCAANNALQPRT